MMNVERERIHMCSGSRNSVAARCKECDKKRFDDG